MASDIDENGEVRSVARGDESQRVHRVPVKVNGVEIEVAEEVRVQELIELARDNGAIAGSVNEYVVERVTQEGEFGIDETIRLTEREELLVVPVEPTTVA